MLRKRIIFTLIYSDGFFMQSRNFRLQKVGNLTWLEKNYKFQNQLDCLLTKSNSHTVATINWSFFLKIKTCGKNIVAFNMWQLTYLMSLVPSLSQSLSERGDEMVCIRVSGKGWCTHKYVYMTWP